MTVAADSPVELRTVNVDTWDLPPDAVIRRLTVCMFLHIVGQSLAMQIYPKVVLEFFDDDDARASQFNGWVTMVSCAVQLFTIPSLSGVSDVFGRRTVLAGALGLHGAAMVGLAFRTSSVTAVAACQVLTGLCDVILPVSQAIIVDISSGEGEARGEISHGLGLIRAAFGLAVAIGPILGGMLSEDYRQLACLISVGISVLALTSLRFYGWSETAPRSSSPRESETPGGKRKSPCGGVWNAVNPFSILRVFLGNRLLTLLAQCLFLFALAVNSFTVWYNYFDYKFDWDAVEIAMFYSTFGLCVAFVTGVVIRFLVPTRLTETQAILMGLVLQVLAGVLYGVASVGWMVYATLFITVLVSVTEPCMIAIMAKLVDARLTGSLQGAVMSLRVLAQGIAGPIYGHIFYLGVSGVVRDHLGATIPGLPLFLSSAVSFTAAMIVWCSSASLNMVATDATQYTARDEDEEQSLDRSLFGVEAREEMRATAPAATVGVAMFLREKEASMQEPLLSSPAASPEDFEGEASPGI